MAAPSVPTSDAPEQVRIVPLITETPSSTSYVSGSRPVSGQLWPRLGH